MSLFKSFGIWAAVVGLLIIAGGLGLRGIFYSESRHYMEHARCLIFDWPLIILLIVANGVVAVSYFAIPVGLWKQSLQAEGLALPFSRHILLLFGGFILACGMTHVMQILVLFLPWYWMDMVVVMITAVLSIITAFIFVPKVWRLYKSPPMHELAMARSDIEQARRERLRQAQMDSAESDSDHAAVASLNQALLRIDRLIQKLE